MVLGTVAGILGISVVKKIFRPDREKTGLHDPDDPLHPFHQQLFHFEE